ncbi:MAG TPA: cupin domain-containing protein [Burkholderiales bacterium]|nr:cupin domain-containing protein [Burkholderiales bacterium]
MKKASWVFQLNGDDRGIPRELAKGINASIFPGENVMLSVVKVEPHSTGTVHSHPEEQWGVLLAGRCTRIQSGAEVECTVGDFWCTPGGVPHGVRTGESGATILDIFSPPRAEYKKAGAGFGTTATKTT